MTEHRGADAEPRGRFLLATWDGGGNVGPELAIAARLVARGHEVDVLGDPTIEDEVRGAGCRFRPWTTAPHRRSKLREHDLLRDYAFPRKLEYLDFIMREFLAEPMPRWIADVASALDATAADVMLTDCFLLGPLIVAEARGLPSAVLMPNILTLPTPGIPPIGPGLAPAITALERARHAVVRWVSERFIFGKAVPAINAARRAHRLAPVKTFHEQLLRTDYVLVQSSPAFDLASPAVDPRVRWVGAELAEPAWAGSFSSPWPTGDERPLVVVALSSTFQAQAEVLSTIVRALSTLPVRGLVTLGPSLEPGQVTGTGDVVVVPSAPHGQVFAEASVVVTHCGHGTTMKALVAGAPLVCLPMGRDQNDTAVRVVHRGAGVRLEPTASEAEIRSAVSEVIGDGRYRAAAKALGDAIARRAGCADAVPLIEGLLRSNPSHARPRIE